MAAKVPYIVLQNVPRIYLATIPGKWLRAHCSPSLRIEDPQKGFQRLVKDRRARKIAKAVLAQHRTFPNAIVLATRQGDFDKDRGSLILPGRARFLVVDGQHRLYAEDFSDFDASYATVLHVGLTTEQMALLFLEINDNQKRVAGSLKWDLYRLVNPTKDNFRAVAAFLVYELANRTGSPLIHRIDLTGDRPKGLIPQASIGPEIRSLIADKQLGLRTAKFETQYEVLSTFLSAVRAHDPDGWDDGTSVFSRPLTLRALLRLFGEIRRHEKRPLGEATTTEYSRLLSQLNTDDLRPEVLRKVGGSAGLKATYDAMKQRLFPD